MPHLHFLPFVLAIHDNIFLEKLQQSLSFRRRQERTLCFGGIPFLDDIEHGRIFNLLEVVKFVFRCLLQDSLGGLKLVDERCGEFWTFLLRGFVRGKDGELYN
jgi:hypothetical protein